MYVLGKYRKSIKGPFKHLNTNIEIDNKSSLRKNMFIFVFENYKIIK